MRAAVRPSLDLEPASRILHPPADHREADVARLHRPSGVRRRAEQGQHRRLDHQAGRHAKLARPHHRDIRQHP